MGLFDSLFGGKKKATPPKKEKKAPPAAAVSVSAEAATPGDLTPEIVAAISASINMVMSDDAELIAAVTAAVIHAGGGTGALRIRRTNNTWAAAGRQKLMDSRQAI